MNSIKLEVLWSPTHHNKFVTWGTEIHLYEIAQIKDGLKPSSVKVSEGSAAHLLATNSSNHYVKCIDIYPSVEPDILLAVGQANGKVILNTFGPTVFDTLGLTGKELVPKHARTCNTVAWNPIDTNILVSGLDKYRADQSLLLWDVLKNPSSNERIYHHSTQVETIRPITEAGTSETTHSLSWFHKQPKCLVAGLNNKQLKIFDFRDPMKIVNTTPTKAVYSIAVNPHFDFHLVSVIDSQITIWDTRCFEKPVLTLPQAKPVTKVLWCPTRRNLLGSLQKDSVNLHLHDIQHCGSDKEQTDTEPGALERTIAPPWSNPTSFSWHPTHVNRLVAISQQELTDYTVNERITLNWSTRSHIVWNHASKTFKYIHSQDDIYKTLGDISILTKNRALSEYGLLPDLAQNGELAKNEKLKNLWNWLELSKSLVDDGIIQSADNQHPGVRTVLKMDGQSMSISSMKSELVLKLWSDIDTQAKTYKSPDRDKALLLCGWKFEKENSSHYSQSFLEKLEEEGQYARAAAIYVFNLCLRQAIEVLNRAENKLDSVANFSIVAMALSGFSEDKNSMWRELCMKSKSQLTDPYLRATFSFLTADNDSYENVLNENGMAVEDRVAFALIYLSDSKLYEYLKKLTHQLTEEGNLSGFMLTGASLEGIHLLNKYLDITGDVQSCSLIAIRAMIPLSEENQVQIWIESYRGLLDAWKMWIQRAHFDIAMRGSANTKPPQQMYISCNFCGKSISAFMQCLSRTRGPFARLGNSCNKLKMSACPSCRKPLPRCAICLMHMGTVSGLQMASSENSDKYENTRLTEFGNWFTWCQTCRHGGHANHITHWFQQHSECPVSSCTCRCFSLDASCKVGVGVI